ncbi:MAG TPA: FAD-dependent oxidoreductase [Spirochaetota bacterium]|nr:FAD-dependent oxidoreductase [Spirochaetota bacterium]HPC43400.1 FAD-dependent oxidoreductase [Spirochaetota bacterium]HPL18084.1 FAD-dependent oxidoreductase [Spirochaetota bacterium]HQF10581.1 FAD-dependent oxidoreductase [Spirochaetota bacterium]HQH99567.1 FAD-dependent oxidoreductase [Spirochaetota bacterium]
MKKIVIIGGSDAGISAALRIRELDNTIRPTLVVSDRFPNFSICGLPYYISRDVIQWTDLAHRTKEDIEKAGIDLLLEHTAQSIDTRTKQVAVTDNSGVAQILEYDKLIIATGALSMKPPIPGCDNPGVFFLRWIPESVAIDEFINNHKPKSALIIGAGYIGMEMSEALAKRGLQVTVVEFLESVLPSVDVDFGNRVRDVLVGKGISVHNHISIESIKTNGNTLVVAGSHNFSISVDMVLVSVGGVPNATLGQSIGILTGIKGAFKVNSRMETNMPDIYAAGDCVETWHRILKKYTYLPLGTVAHKQGRIAGENAVGGSREFEGSMGTQSVKIFDTVVARTGLNDKEAAQGGYQPVSADFETWDHKAYYPQAEKLYMRVTADRKTKRILGAQILGAYKTEVSKRIDIFATAIYHEVTVAEFSNYDLSYTPPLSSPWDPVQMAVQNLEKQL